MIKKCKKRTLKILLILFLLSCISIPVSYARYVSNFNDKPKLEVAKWNFIINNESISEEINFNLFEAVNNSNIKDGINAIAPGTSGKAEINIVNNSDVTAEYLITVTELENNYDIPIVYSFDKEGTYKDINDFIFPLIEEIKIGEEKNITLYWKWQFYVDDISNNRDNELSKIKDAALKVKINLDINQKI